MDRLQTLLNFLISHHQQQVQRNVKWEKESYTLGRIAGIREAMSLLKDSNSIIPAELID